MAASPEEQLDLTILHAAQADEYWNFSDRCRHFLHMNETLLKHSGHKSLEAALVYSAHSHVKALDRLVAAHMKKWPD